MARFMTSVVLLFSCMIHFTYYCFSEEDSKLLLRCLPKEREALLKFKEGLIDPTHRLSSWVLSQQQQREDCCTWNGITCDNTTGHVIKLDLRNPFLYERRDFYHGYSMDFTYERGLVASREVNPSLLELKHLNYLDLSCNNFSYSKIPNFFGSFHELRYLNLSFAMFGGVIPPHLGNLSNLLSLDFSSITYVDSTHLSTYSTPIIENMNWISHLSSLQHLDMSGMDLSNVTSNETSQFINLLPSSLKGLRLSNCQLSHLSSSSFLNNFTSLSILDLRWNDFEGPIPTALWNMTSLIFLDLSTNSFTSNRPILDSLGNLCSLKTLYLSGNKLAGKIIDKYLSSPCFMDTLESLDLSSNNELSGYLPNWLGQFKNLKYLSLSYNSFYGPIPTSLGSLSTLRELHLNGNQLNGPIPTSLGSLSTLRELYLHDNQLNGPIPTSLGSLSTLRTLSLYSNHLNGTVPTSLGSLSTLRELYLTSNHLNGTVPESLGQLSELKELDLSFNSLKGVVSEVHFSQLSKLQYLDMSSNSLVLKVRPDWAPPFQLNSLGMSSCVIGPLFPKWLRTQTTVTYLDISNASISDSIPNWFVNHTSHLSSLNLSHNQIHGKVPTFVASNNQSLNMYLSSNKFEGHLPHFPSNLYILDLSNNSISGTIPQSIGDMMPGLQSLVLSDNVIGGNIPRSLCKMMNLQLLDLSKNQLYGHLPHCLGNLSILVVLDLSSNHLSGVIPNSMVNQSGLQSLHLNNNSFTGMFPLALQNCFRLIVLDLGENKLSGNMPAWIGKSLTSLQILRLKSNNFDGDIPSELCHLSHLQIMDLASNNLSGIIPRCFGNFNAMASNQTGQLMYEAYISIQYTEQITEVIRGREDEYRKLLPFIINMDLSDNKLVGQIPEELTDLYRLYNLNLSRNFLIGSIPAKIGQLSSLESLDLSKNRLSGTISQSLSNLTFLNHLNLSYNNLSGQIPSGNQLQTLNDPSIYRDNPELCGVPLEKKCLGDVSSQAPTGDEEESKIGWFHVGMASGFVVGNWGVFGVLLFKKTWRYVYFQFVDDITGTLYMVIVVSVTRLKKRVKCNPDEE